MLNEPVRMTTPNKDIPMNTSYEIIWAEPRMAPNREYLLLEAHPPNTTLKAPMDDMARKKSKPMLRLTTINRGAKGMIAKLMRIVIMRIAGASTNTLLSANLGI